MNNRGRGMPGRKGMPVGGKPPKEAISKENILRLLSYFKPYRGSMAVVVLCLVISSITGVIASVFLRTLIDDYITPMVESGSRDFSGLARAVATMGVVLLAGVAATFIYNRVMVTVSQGILRTVRDDMFSHMQTLPIKYFDTNTHGDIMSHYTNDTDTLRQMISQSIPNVVSSLITIVSVFVAMLATSWILTIFVLVTVALMMLATAKIAGKSAGFFVKQQTMLGNVNGYVEEMMHGQKVIKVFTHEKLTKEEFDRRNDELCDTMTNANTFANILMPIMSNLGNVQFVLIAIIGGAIAIATASSGHPLLTLGAIASFLQLSKSFTNPITQVSQQINSIAMAMAGADRIFKLLDSPSEQDNGYVTLVNARCGKDGRITETEERTGIWAWKHPHTDGTLTYTRLEGDVRLTEVDFSYVEGKRVLEDVTLYAKPGQKVAFVGATGAGKTTITNLINRFYDIEDGKIRYDGININKIKKNDLRRSLGVVLQDVNLFTGTVMENIRYGKLDATDEEVISAAKLANAHDFITRLPKGYDTMLDGDGGSLSQGQRQLISIARAAVADPPVMILDEATSSIDTRTEAIVQKGMDALMRGRTVFVIAHRLSTVRNADVIMVLDHGRIIERGSHEQLIAEKGQYYRLYTGAFELE